MNYVKLFARYGSNNLTIRYIINRKIPNHSNIQFCCNSTLKKFLTEFNEESSFFDKIIYNEVLGIKGLSKNTSDTFEGPICLKFITEEENKKVKENAVEEPETVHFPYEVKNRIFDDADESEIELKQILPQEACEVTPVDSKETKEFEWSSNTSRRRLRKMESISKWTVVDNDGLEIDSGDTTFKFGSCDPHRAVSSIPCGGCGALLHCNDPAIPGFIPLQIFEEKTKDELRGEICQRCVYLRQFDIALGVTVKASEYSRIISAIKEKEAMVILMIDLLDFPCSIYPGILELIGPKPVIIVANKIDLLIQEGPTFLRNFKESLIWSLKKQKLNLENIKHISLISAKTGYGVENLIDVIYNNWGNKGDIYIVGCTNAGKSTLFNTLIQSDFCKVKAIDILQRATISAWPGTTLNLIKFPIRKQTEALLIARSMRLRKQGKEIAAVEKYQWLGQNLKLEQIPLKGYVGITGKEGLKLSQSFETDPNETTRKGINPAGFDFAKGRWFYDTPGVVHYDQIVNLLTTSELLLTIPRKMLLPRNFHLRPGQSLFIGGLARLDYTSGPDMMWFTVYASIKLPVTITKLEDADHVYEKLLGSPLFAVPMKGKERLSKWPKLASKKFEIVGKLARGSTKYAFKGNSLPKQADADVVLSSAGWVSVTGSAGYIYKIQAWTPEGRGIHLREIPIIKTGHTFRGSRILKTPAFSTVVKEVEGYSVTEEPPW